MLTSCSDTPPPQPQSEPIRSQSNEEVTQQQPSPELELLPPPRIGNEGPLRGNIPEIPNVYLVPSRQSKAALAAYLKTTPIQLDWVNPRLSDPISPGTLVVIPPLYRVDSSERLSDIVNKTGLPEEPLRAMNPELDGQDILAEGMVLIVPPLYIVPTDTSLSSVANTLKVNDESLLSANQGLADREDIQAGTVLIVLPER